MAITIYNTKSKKKEAFVPLITGQVSMYVCGVTVYDDCHLGHARSALTFDMIRCYLEFSGYQVTYVRNFTDIDDKILQRAEKDGVAWNEISKRYIKAFYRDMGALGITKPTVEPRATEHMADILRMVEGLVNKDMAYQIEGDVYFFREEICRLWPTVWKKIGRVAGRREDLRLIPGSKIPWTLPYGKLQSLVSLDGTALGERAVRVGTSNVRPCR